MADSIIETWNSKNSKAFLDAPKSSDNKYRRGVLGCLTGDRKYPGAALMTTAAALATGIGMVRFLGPRSVGKEVVQFRPAVVLADGKVDALLIGSGTGKNLLTRIRILKDLKRAVPKILDAGALDLVTRCDSRTIITPHAGELSRLIGVPSSEIEKHPDQYAEAAARKFQVTVLLKGWQTVLANSERIIKLPPAPTWLATAGTGDVLAGILGALVAINHDRITSMNLIEVGATAAFVHAEAAAKSSNGPLDIERMINEISNVIYEIVTG